MPLNKLWLLIAIVFSPLLPLLSYFNSASLAFWALPSIIGFIVILLSLRAAAAIAIFFLFSGIAWGLELAGAFLITAAIFGISVFINKFFLPDNREIFLDRTFLFILFYTLFMLISILDAPYQLVSFPLLLNFAKIVLLYLLIINAFDRNEDFKRIMWIAVLAVFVSCLYGYYEFLTGNLVGDLFEKGFRFRGLTSDPNILAMHILFAVSFLIYFFFYTSRVWMKLAFVISILFFIVSLVITLSRSAVIALAVLIFIIVWDFRDRKWPVGLILVSFLIFFIAAPDFFIERIQSLGNIQYDPSLRWRARLYEGALDLFFMHPLNGFGLGNFIVISNKFVMRHLVVHNTFLEILAECGVFALLSFILILWSVLRNLRQAASMHLAAQNTTMALICRSLRASIIASLIMGLFLSIQHYMLLWVMFGFATICRKLAPKTVNELK